VKALPSPRAHRKDARRWPPIECTRVIEDKFLKASPTFGTQFATSSKFLQEKGLTSYFISFFECDTILSHVETKLPLPSILASVVETK
jgi:hypothetical protein